MDFYQPLALLGLLSLPAIIAMHLLKQKHKEITVPSLYLWKEVMTLHRDQRPWQRLKRSLLLFLQLVAAALLAVSIAGPFIPGMIPIKNTILVLDCSMSMKTSDLEPSRFEQAKETIAATIRNAKAGTHFSIIAATGDPYIATGFSEDKSSLLKELDRLTPLNTGIDIESVGHLIQMLRQQSEADIYVFTDGGLRLDELWPGYVIFGEPVDNMAITLVSHTQDGDEITVLVKVKNYGERSVKNAVALYADDEIADIREFIAEPREEKDLFFIRVPIQTGRVTARLEKTDLLAIDDTGYDWVTDIKKEKVLLTTDANVFLENALTLMPNAVLYKSETESITDDKGYYLYVYDGVLPDSLPTDGHLLIINPPEGNSFIQTQDDISVDRINIENRRLMNLIPQFEFNLLKTKEITAPDWADVLMSSPQTPIIFTGEESGRKVAVIGFDFHNTDWVLKKEFPIFIYNLLQWFIPAEVTGKSLIVANDAITFHYEPDADEISIVTPSGDTQRLAPPFPPDMFTKTDEPGFYTLRQTAAGENRFSTFPVNVNCLESDLLSIEIPPKSLSVQAEKGMGNISLKPFILLSLLILLTIEWWVYGCGVRV